MAINMENNYHLAQDTDCRRFSRKKHYFHQRAVKVCSQLKRHGVHSYNRMRTAGFVYTGQGDTARCEACGLEVTGWLREMDPFSIHLERSSECSFIRFVRSKCKSVYDYEETSVKRQKTESTTVEYSQQNKFSEVNILKEARRRTFSDWPHRTTPTAEQMIAAGFFRCNVGDRTICLYCNLICQQWKADENDPSEVHKTLSPKCPYVRFVLMNEDASSVLIVNDITTNNDNNQANLLNNINRIGSDQIVYTSPCHVAYSSIPSREATFVTWNNQSSPAVDDLVRAGFFYTGAKSIATCFYCNGSLQNWSAKDSPLIEHARWFPYCAYAKQLCGTELYNKIQNTKLIQQERAKSNNSATTTSVGDSSVTNNQRLQITDDTLLSRLVAARLDLPISQRLLNQNFKLSIVKRCWEDQLRLKHDDFVNDYDILIACVILKKQIDGIDGKKENIIIPSIKMQLIRDRGQSDTMDQEKLNSSSLSTDSSSDTSAQVSSSTESLAVAATTEEIKEEERDSTTKSLVNNPCVVCYKEEKRLACIPCGHLAACVNCSQSLRTCPVCRRGIEAFVRIYV